MQQNYKQRNKSTYLFPSRHYAVYDYTHSTHRQRQDDPCCEPRHYYRYKLTFFYIISQKLNLTSTTCFRLRHKS